MAATESSARQFIGRDGGFFCIASTVKWCVWKCLVVGDGQSQLTTDGSPFPLLRPGMAQLRHHQSNE